MVLPFVLSLSILCHELGHRKTAWKLGLEASCGWRAGSFVTSWVGGSVDDEIRILKGGIYFGAVPLCLFTLFLDWVGFFPILVSWLLYFLGSYSDFRSVLSLGGVFVRLEE